MNTLLLTVIVIILIYLLYLNVRIRLKSSITKGNLLVQSETTSNVLNEMQKQEAFEQEQGLMKNARYRALKAALNLEISHYKSLSLDEVENTFKNSKTMRREINHEGFRFLLQVKCLPSSTSPALHLTIKPKSLFGSFFSIDEWINY